MCVRVLLLLLLLQKLPSLLSIRRARASLHSRRGKRKLPSVSQSAPGSVCCMRGREREAQKVKMASVLCALALPILLLATQPFASALCDVLLFNRLQARERDSCGQSSLPLSSFLSILIQSAGKRFSLQTLLRGKKGWRERMPLSPLESACLLSLGKATVQSLSLLLSFP